MDQLLNLKNFPILSSFKTEGNEFKSIRLLRIFGQKGCSVIFATKEDIVYGFGDNSNGCLGLGNWHKNIPKPQINHVFSHNKVVDISIGEQHCLGLTHSGQVYTWGRNKFAVLGIGKGRDTPTPQLFTELNGIQVVQICCGSSFSMALTSLGNVFMWGRNSDNELLMGTAPSIWPPKQLLISDILVSICCGLNHCIGVTNTGRVYLWGIIQYRKKVVLANPDVHPTQPPGLLQGLDHLFIKKAVCGPNYSVLLTAYGNLYAFGSDSDGQLGKGRYGDVLIPLWIRTSIIFKDIVASTAENLTVGVSEDNQYFVWGYVDSTRVDFPKRVNDPSIRSVFDAYSKFAKSKVTVQTIVVNQDFSFDTNLRLFADKTQDINKWLNNRTNDLNKNNCSPEVYSTKTNITIVNNFDTNKDTIVEDKCIIDSPTTTNFDNHSSICEQSVITETYSQKVFHNFIINSFNNEEKCDLRLVFRDKTIYCDKSFLKFRNKQFWQKCKNQFKNGIKDEIRVKPHLYDSFLPFIQHLYGQTPEINEENCSHLMKMAAIYEELELQDLCEHFLNNPRINLSNVCSLYEKAVENDSTDLKNSCIEFVSKNLRKVLISEEFQSMDVLSSMQLIQSLTQNISNHLIS